MNAREWVNAVITGAMAVTAMLGSIYGLVAFAQQGLAGDVTIPLGSNGEFTLPLGTLAFVAAVDGLALAMTVQVHDVEDGVDLWALAVLVAITTFSAVLQCIATPDPIPGREADAWKIRVAHTVPAPFAAVAAAMFFRSLHRSRHRIEAGAAAAAEAERERLRTEAEAAQREERRAAREAARVAPAQPTPPTSAPLPAASEAGRVDANTLVDDSEAGAGAADPLLPDAIRIATEAPRRLGRDSMQAALKKAGHGVGKERAKALADNAYEAITAGAAPAPESAKPALKVLAGGDR